MIGPVALVLGWSKLRGGWRNYAPIISSRAKNDLISRKI